MYFTQIVRKFNIPKSHFFRYLQIRDFVRKFFLSSFPSQTTVNWLEDCIQDGPNKRNFVSHIYNVLLSVASPSLDDLKSKWEEDFGERISDEIWKVFIARIQTSSICVRHSLIQFKVVHRLHLSRSRLVQFYPDLDPTCQRCNQGAATIFNSFWVCPRMGQFWAKVFETLSYVYNKPKDPEPTLAIFGVARKDFNLS